MVIVFSCLFTAFTPGDAMSYQEENVNCDASQCPIPDMPVGAEDHGIVTAACQIPTTKINMNCFWKSEQAQHANPPCEYTYYSGGLTAKCACANNATYPYTLKGVVHCNPAN